MKGSGRYAVENERKEAAVAFSDMARDEVPAGLDGRVRRHGGFGEGREAMGARL